MSFFASTSTTTGPAFCPHCGSILDHPDTNNIVCSACEYRCHYEGMEDERENLSMDEYRCAWAVLTKTL